MNALRSGGTGFLVEPVSLTALLELIERQYDIHSESPYRVLVMEDSKAQAKYYEKVLIKGHFDIRVVNDPAVLLEALRGFDPEVVLMDMQMPGISGVELTRIIRQMPRYAFLPIIFLSAEENERKQNQALASGGTGFIVKPVQKSALLFNAELHAARYRSLYPQISINPDTGLGFSRHFKQQVSIEAIRMSRSGGCAVLAIIQCDQLDDLVKEAKFSVVNLATQQLAQILKHRLRKTDIIGHIETGQLGVILNSGHKQDWFGIMEEIKSQLSELSFQIQQQETSLTISIGMALLAGNSDAHQWFANAYKQLDIAIQNGGNIVQSDHPSE
jgi:diguanylate cyclase (GGDEF)-like protein